MGYKKIDPFLDRVAEESSRKRKGRAIRADDEGTDKGRVLACWGRITLVRAESGEEIRIPASKPLTPVAGDEVMIQGGRVVGVVQRGKVLARADADRTQVIASNIDRVVLVQTVSNPPFRAGLTDRYLVYSTIMDLPLLLVLNKTDDPTEDGSKIFDYCRSLNVDALLVSAKNGQGMDELSDRLSEGVSVFSGHSGVGKSSLLACLLPGTEIGIGELSETSGLGRQKTTTTRAYPFRNGYLIDTPGIRQFGFVGVDPSDVARAFPEISELASECRYRNCLHDTEPGCAVKKAVEENRLAGKRYLSYQRIVSSVKF